MTTPNPDLQRIGAGGLAAVTGPGWPRVSVPQALNIAAIVMLGLYFGRELLVPMVLAVLLAFVLAPAATLLRRARLGHAGSVLVAVFLAFAVIGGIGVVVVRQATSLADALPTYQSTIQEKVRSFSVATEVVERLVASARRVLTGASQDEPAVAEVQAGQDHASTLVVVRTVLQPLLGPVVTAGIVVVFLIFVLLNREDLRDRLVRLVGRRDLHRTILALDEASRRLSRFFIVQLMLNAGFGAFIACALWGLGLPSPLLWGILAGLMRFVPFIGGAIALAPPLLLALAVSPGWGMAAAVLAIILGADVVMGQFVEPLTYGHNTGVSPVAVILSTAFWAFLWGPIGLLLATPLTVCLVVVGRHVEALSFFHVVLGSDPPLEPAETFYQRALEGNHAELLRQARAAVARSGMADYADNVALAGIGLAQDDLTRDALDFDRLEGVHARLAALLQALRGHAGEARSDGREAPPPWRAEGSVLCIPGRGPMDDLAAELAVQALAARGFGAAVLPNGALGARARAAPGPAEVRLCCVSVMDGGSSTASIRLFLRRIQREMPGAAVVVGLWRATADSPTLAELRAEGAEEFIVLSVSELAALALALSARGQSAAVPAMGAAPAPAGGAG